MGNIGGTPAKPHLPNPPAPPTQPGKPTQAAQPQTPAPPKSPRTPTPSSPTPPAHPKGANSPASPSNPNSPDPPAKPALPAGKGITFGGGRTKRHKYKHNQNRWILKKRYYGRKNGKVIPLYGHKISKRIGRHASYIIWKTTKKNLPGKTFYGKFYTTRKAAHFQ